MLDTHFSKILGSAKVATQQGRVAKQRAHALLTVGFKNWKDKVGNPKWPNRV